MTATKTPTPQGVSALLRKAGFQKSVSQGRAGQSTGYEVSRDYGTGCVRVRHITWSMNPPDHVTEGALAKYAEAITAAGYQVLSPSPRWILVTAKDEED